MEININKIIQKTKKLAKVQILSRSSQSGHVATTIITKDNNEYNGVSLEIPCEIGFCAEHSAIAAMVANNEHNIEYIVSVHYEKGVIPPCGRCRELMNQISDWNYDNTKIILNNEIIKLCELLPKSYN